MQSAIEYIRTELQNFYPDTEIRSFINLLISKVTGFNRTQIVVNKNTKISDEQRFLIQSFVEKLKKNEPIQYILGETEFYGLTFKVNDSVLIPRPETEELVEWVKSENENPQSILDIGTGSGCIAISLKSLLPATTITAFDISEKALETATENARLNQVDVKFEKTDILNNQLQNKQWNIIVSNPPYIPENEMSEILPNVLDYEPHLALFVPDNDPLLFYRKIAQFGKSHLTAGGKLYFEIHRDAGDSCVQMLRNAGYEDIVLRRDIFGNNRMIRAIKV